jgi:hypothetical protein
MLAVSAMAVAAYSQTTSFTYQGTLTDQGSPANGNYDMQFKLYDSLGGGTQIGSTLTRSPVAVANGGFTVALDFGAAGFPGADRFLEISVRPPKGVFTMLVPRTQVLSSPYAVRAFTVTGPVAGTSASAVLSVTNDQPGITNPSLDNLPPSALKGEATSATNTNVGLVGIGYGSTGIGVIGVTRSGSATEQLDPVGVLGVASSPTGAGIAVSADNETPQGTAIDAQTVGSGYIFKGSGHGAGNVSITGTGNMTLSGMVEIGGTMNIGNLPSGGSAPLCVGPGNVPNIIKFCSSSYRYKRDIRPFSGGLALVDRLRPIAFAWKEDGSREIGLGAEDVAKVDPRLTFNNNQGEVEGVKYGQLAAVLINAIKEQQAQIERQQAQIDALTREVRRSGRHTLAQRRH